MKYIIALVIGLASALGAQAQALKIATGSSSGTYSRLVKEASTACMAATPIAEVNTTGSMQNLDKLIGNEVQTGMVQTDVLFFRSRTEDLANIKTLVAFHPEQVHIVVKSEPIKEGGVLGVGSKTIVLNQLPDLVGRTIAAAGGSFITAQVIRLQTEVNFNVVEVDTADDALKLVSEGKVSAALLVGGAPLGNLAKLGKEYKLVAFPESAVAKLKNVYKPTRLNYSKMGSTGVSSVATDAVLVSREFKTPKMVDSLTKLRECILKNSAELAETSGTHPAWQSVDASNKGKWPWYEFSTKK